ncbi:MAG: intradiol ring-cleavage dioxygenase [Ilumatobacteraceae bacterium]
MIDNVTRRQLLGAGASALGVGVVLAGCSGDSESSATPDATTPPVTAAEGTNPPEVTSATAAGTATPSSDAPTTSAAIDLTRGTPSTTALTAADFGTLGTCPVLPQTTEGPFPSLEMIERRDITEGMPGHPLRIGVQVVDRSCAPIAGARVEIWHCDVDGDYSSYSDGATVDDAAEGTNFFRGYQTANLDGIVEFLTCYPGWYRGRAIHVHSKIHTDDTTVLTTQYLFDDALNEAIMAQGVYAPYGAPDTTNAEDGVTRGVAEAGGLIMTASDDPGIGGTRALIVVGVDPGATA